MKCPLSFIFLCEKITVKEPFYGSFWILYIITDFQDMRTFIDFDDIYEEIRQHIQDIDDESIFVLKSGTASLTGAVTGSASFDSSSNLSINTTMQTNDGSDITIPLFDTTDGTSTIKFCRRGQVVHVECWINLNTNHESGMVTEEVTIPDWAKTTMSDTNHLKPLVTGKFIGNNIDNSRDNYFSLIKLVNGKYRVAGLVFRTLSDSNQSYYCAGTYIV